MSLLEWLRGPSKSLRYRFITNPANKLQYLTNYRAVGRTRLDYWADAIDKVQYPRIDRDLSKDYLENGRQQFEYLIDNGLKPHHRFLDYGCGPMRGGLHIVPYLSEGLYVGADISRVFIQRGVRLLEKKGIQRDRYQVVTIRDFDLTCLYGFEFDFGASFSALQYVSDEDLKRILTGLRPLLKGPFHYNFPAPNKKAELAMKGQYYRSPERIAAIAEPLGYTVTFQDGYPGDPMAILQ